MMRSNRFRVAFLLALAGACSSKSPPSTVIVTFALPIGLREATAQSIGRVDLFIDEGGSASLFSTPTTVGSSATEEGTPFEHQIADVDGDGKLEFYFSFPSNPFGYARSRALTFIGDPSLGAFVLRANIYKSNSSALLASATATVDSAGNAISFGAGAPQVTLSFECVPLLNCPTMVDGGLTGPIEMDGGVVDGNIAAVLKLPSEMSNEVRNAIDTVELVFDDTGQAALFTATTTAAASRTSDGVGYSSQLRNVDGDNGTEYVVTIHQNPFVSETSWDMPFIGSSTIAPFVVRARLFRNDGGTLVATAIATTDDAGASIQFGASDKSVPVGFACVSAELCVTLDASAPVVEDAGEDAGADAGAEADAGAGTDAGVDAGAEPDAGVDAGPDASIDAGVDAGIDAGADAGLCGAGCSKWQDAGSIPGSGVGYQPDVAVTSGGNAMAVWKTGLGSPAYVWASRFDRDAGAWGPALRIDDPVTGSREYPRVGMDIDGNAIAVWQGGPGPRWVLYANRYDAVLGRWDDAGPIASDQTWDVTSPELAVSAQGNAMVLSYRNGTILWNRFVADAGGWTDAGVFANGASYTLSVGPLHYGFGGNGFGGFVSSSQVFVTKWKSDGGQGGGPPWGSPTRLDIGGSGAGDLSIAVNENGNAVAVWHQSDGVVNRVWANRYSADVGLWGDAGMIESWDAGTAYVPQVVLDSANSATVVWQQSFGSSKYLCANRYDWASGLWGDAGIIDSAPVSNDTPSIGVDSEGNVTAVYGRSGAVTTIGAVRLSAATGLWGDTGYIEPVPGYSSSAPRVRVFTGGRAISVWSSQEGTDRVDCNFFQ